MVDQANCEKKEDFFSFAPEVSKQISEYCKKKSRSSK